MENTLTIVNKNDQNERYTVTRQNIDDQDDTFVCNNLVKVYIGFDGYFWIEKSVEDHFYLKMRPNKETRIYAYNGDNNVFIMSNDVYNVVNTDECCIYKNNEYYASLSDSDNIVDVNNGEIVFEKETSYQPPIFNFDVCPVIVKSNTECYTSINYYSVAITKSNTSEFLTEFIFRDKIYVCDVY